MTLHKTDFTSKNLAMHPELYSILFHGIKKQSSNFSDFHKCKHLQFQVWTLFN